MKVYKARDPYLSPVKWGVFLLACFGILVFAVVMVIVQQTGYVPTKPDVAERNGHLYERWRGSWIHSEKCGRCLAEKAAATRHSDDR